MVSVMLYLCNVIWLGMCVFIPQLSKRVSIGKGSSIKVYLEQKCIKTGDMLYTIGGQGFVGSAQPIGSHARCHGLRIVLWNAVCLYRMSVSYI